jgi:hypothetical protein
VDSKFGHEQGLGFYRSLPSGILFRKKWKFVRDFCAKMREARSCLKLEFLEKKKRQHKER